MHRTTPVPTVADRQRWQRNVWTVDDRHAKPPARPRFDVSDADKRRRSRARRFALRRDVQRLTAHRGVAACGRASTGGVVSVVRSGEGVARYTGLQTCGSIWACPVCSAKIRQYRADELREGLTAHLAAGGGAYFTTLTMRHGPSMALADTLDTVLASWRRLAQGRSPVLRQPGIIGTVRATEVTHGAHGWHPHIHGLILTEKPLTDEQRQGLAASIFSKWSETVVRQMGPSAAPTRAGFRFEEVATSDAVARYLAKVQDAEALAAGYSLGSLSMELTRFDLKSAAKGSRTPFEIAQHAAQLMVEHGPDARGVSFDLWREYEDATRGRRAMSWSKGLRRYLAGIADVDATERTDADLAGDELASDDDVLIAQFEHQVWATILARGLQAAILDAAEQPSPIEAMHQVLDRSSG